MRNSDHDTTYTYTASREDCDESQLRFWLEEKEKSRASEKEKDGEDLGLRKRRKAGRDLGRARDHVLDEIAVTRRVDDREHVLLSLRAIQGLGCVVEGLKLRVYRGTSLMRNSPPPSRTTTGP